MAEPGGKPKLSGPNPVPHGEGTGRNDLKSLIYVSTQSLLAGVLLSPLGRGLLQLWRQPENPPRGREGRGPPLAQPSPGRELHGEGVGSQEDQPP